MQTLFFQNVLEEDMQFKNLLKKKYQSINLEVGFFESAYLNGTSVAEVALYQEYGTETIPSRPFMRNTIRNKKGWDKVIEKVLRSNKGLDEAFSILGAVVSNDMRKEINKGDYTPLKQSTIDSKGFAKPLIDTGFMMKSVDWRIV